MIRDLQAGFEVRYRTVEADGSFGEWSAWLHNALMNEGERNLLEAYLRNQNAPSQFFVRLFADVPVLTDSLASLGGEPGGLAGYAPQLLARSAVGWPTVANDGLNIAALSAVVTFGPALTLWPNALTSCLCTSSDNTGLLIDATTLSQARQLVSGQSLQAQYKIRMV